MARKQVREYSPEELILKKTLRAEGGRELKVKTTKFRVWLGADGRPSYEGFYQGQWRACGPDGTFR